MAKCQRYFVSYGLSHLRIRALNVTPNVIDFVLPLPVTMQGMEGTSATPTLVSSNLDFTLYNINFAAQDSTNFAVAIVSDVYSTTNVTLRLTKASHGLSDCFISVRGYTAGYDKLMLSRDL